MNNIVNNKEELHINLFNYEATFCFGLVKLQDLPMNEIPQVAFWGRSNVGKSSLLNTIFNKKKLVRVSNTPGRTRELNFFTILNKIYFVDLPGYGYAKFDKKIKEKWTDIAVSFIDESFHLKKIYLLIDAKVGILSLDKEAIEFLEHVKKNYQIVLTKVDKISAKNLQLNVDSIKRFLSDNSFNSTDFIHVSSKNKIGLDNIKSNIINTIKT